MLVTTEQQTLFRHVSMEVWVFFCKAVKKKKERNCKDNSCLQIITYFNLSKLYIVHLLNLFWMSLFLPKGCRPEIDMARMLLKIPKVC